MKVREHRGGLQESLDTMFEVETKQELVDAISERLESEFELIDVAFIHQGYDERAKWDTYLISVRGYGVFGYSDSAF